MNLVTELPDQRPVDKEAMSAVTYASRWVTARNNILFQKTNYSVSGVVKRNTTATVFAKKQMDKKKKDMKGAEQNHSNSKDRKNEQARKTTTERLNSMSY